MSESGAILVVEDQYLLRLGALDLVETAGFIGIGAANADEAISILEARQDIRIVLTDVEMRGTVDGVKLAHFVRERWPPVHLIIVSGKAVLQESRMRAGCKFYSRPYHDQPIIAKLQRLTVERLKSARRAPRFVC